MVEDITQIAELEINPVKILKRGYSVVDDRLLLLKHEDS